jgi:outer membrane protein assembly factor BamB
MHCIFLSLMLFSAAETTTWPGFLGAGASVIDPTTVPTEWSPSSGIAWTASIPGYGQSSPVVWGENIIVTSVEGANKETLHVTCFDLASGDKRWDSTTESTYPEKNSVYISRAAPTALLDANGTYAYFESGDVFAVSTDGKQKWHRSLTNDYGKPTNEFGVCASPVQLADRIVILIDDPGNSYLVALDKATGKVLWKTDRTSRTSWSSPALITIEGRPQIVCSSAGSVDGYDPATGKQLWTTTAVGGNSATTPMAVSDGGFLIAASPGQRGENADLAKQSNGRMVVESDGDKWNVRFVWTNEAVSPSWASPIAYQGQAYWINRVGALFCVDANDGTEVYTNRIKQSAWATPVGIGEHVFVFGKNGITTILAAGPEFRVVAENTLWTADAPPVNNVPATEEAEGQRRQAAAMFSKPVVYGVAIVNGSILLRTGSQLYCIRK